MNSLQGLSQCRLIARQQQVSDGFYGTQAHPRRSSGGEDAIDQLFPEPLIRACFPHCAKLRETLANLTGTHSARGAYVFNSDGLLVASHEVSMTIEDSRSVLAACQRSWEMNLIAGSHLERSACISSCAVLHQTEASMSLTFFLRTE